MTCKDCIHYCVCKDTVADENWTDEAPAEIRKMFSPEGCENFTEINNTGSFIKRLFCKHIYEFSASTLIDAGMRKLVVHKCKHCGKLKIYIV